MTNHKASVYSKSAGLRPLGVRLPLPAPTQTPDYRDSYAYRDANYGSSGYYLAQVDYNYYFREGFQRGYEDGFSSR